MNQRNASLNRRDGSNTAQPKAKIKTILTFGSLACISCFSTESLSTKWRYPLRWKSDVVKGKGQGQGGVKIKGKGKGELELGTRHD